MGYGQKYFIAAQFCGWRWEGLMGIRSVTFSSAFTRGENSNPGAPGLRGLDDVVVRVFTCGCDGVAFRFVVYHIVAHTRVPCDMIPSIETFPELLRGFAASYGCCRGGTRGRQADRPTRAALIWGLQVLVCCHRVWTRYWRSRHPPPRSRDPFLADVMLVTVVGAL